MRAEQGFTALHIAAKCGHKEVVDLLLDKGAEKNATTQKGTTALHIAAKYGHKEVVDLLLRMGAEPTTVDIDQSIFYLS